MLREFACSTRGLSCFSLLWLRQSCTLVELRQKHALGWLLHTSAPLLHYSSAEGFRVSGGYLGSTPAWDHPEWHSWCVIQREVCVPFVPCGCSPQCVTEQRHSPATPCSPCVSMGCNIIKPPEHLALSRLWTGYFPKTSHLCRPHCF